VTRISPKGVIIGGVVDIVATNLVALPVLIVAAAKANAAQLPKEEQARALLDTLQASPALLGIQLVLGSLCSVLGGISLDGLRSRTRSSMGRFPRSSALGSGSTPCSRRPTTLAR